MVTHGIGGLVCAHNLEGLVGHDVDHAVHGAETVPSLVERHAARLTVLQLLLPHIPIAGQRDKVKGQSTAS